MNKKHLLPLLIIALLLASCQKEEGHYRNCSLRVHVNLNTAFDGLLETNEGDFMLDDKHAIRVQNFLYDVNGTLVGVVDEKAEQYTEYPTYRFDNLDNGDYILVTATDVMEREGKAYRPVFWEFLGTKSLSTFTVHGTDRMDSMGERMLTLTMSYVTVNGRRPRVSLDVDVEAVTALVCNTYFDIFYWDDHTVGDERRNRIYSYFDISYDHDYNTVTYSPGQKGTVWAYSVSGTESDYYTLDRIDPNKLHDMGVQNIYGYHALLPGDYAFVGYGEYKFSSFSSELFTDETRPTGLVQLRPGRQYYVDFDVKDWCVTLDAANTRSTDVPAGDDKPRHGTEFLLPNPTNPLTRPTR